MRLMEIMGIYVKHGLLHEDIMFDYWIPTITTAWDVVQTLGVIETNRRRVDPQLWVNFEWLIRRYKAWQAAHPASEPIMPTAHVKP